MKYFPLFGVMSLVISFFPASALAAAITQPTVTTRADGLSVVVSWTTSEPATSKVSYGAGNPDETITPEYPSNTTNHQMLIMNLIPEETYAFVAISQTGSNETLRSDATTFTMPAFSGKSPSTFVETVTGSPSLLAPWKQQVKNLEPGLYRSAMLIFLTILDQFSILRIATLVCALGILGYTDARRKQTSFQVVDHVTHEPIATSVMSLIDATGRVARQIAATTEGLIHMAWPMTKPLKVIIEADGYQSRQVIFDRDLYTISLSKGGGGANVMTENWLWRLQHSLKYQHYVVWLLGVLMVLLSINQSFDLVSQSLIILYIGLGVLVIRSCPQTYQFAQLVDTGRRPLTGLPVHLVYSRGVQQQISDDNGFLTLHYPLPSALRIAKAGYPSQDIPIDGPSIQGVVATQLIISLGDPHVSDTPAV